MEDQDEFDYDEPNIDATINEFVSRIFNNATFQTSNATSTYTNNLFMNNDYTYANSHNYINDGFETETFNIFNLLNPLFVDYIDPLFADYIDPIDRVLQESMENQPDPFQKTEHVITISSQRYDSICEEIKAENKQCSICMITYDVEDMISITKCNHIFHTDCIKEWGRYKTDCPICREKLE